MLHKFYMHIKGRSELEVKFNIVNKILGQENMVNVMDV